MAKDTPPPSLRGDQLHYNAAGRAVWANAVSDFIKAKGWLRPCPSPAPDSPSKSR